MRIKTTLFLLSLVSFSLFFFSCKKEYAKESIPPQQETIYSNANKGHLANSLYDLNVVLHGLSNQSEENEHGHEGRGRDNDDKASGFLKFRQDPDPAKIVNLDIRVHNLLANHEYLLQRAVDPINVVDGNCTSTTWLTLGKGLVPQSILTDAHGRGREELWRDVSAVPTGSTFDIHFQVVDKVSNEVVLTSDCYQYMVR